jgi:protein-L-isoaspartate(D-aspartate) O-methyltransferase
MLDFPTARLNMVESQVRPNGITDSRIIRAMLDIPREDFVPPDKRALAYMDEDIPLTSAATGGPERVLVEPMAFARLVQLARIGPEDVVLHVGAGTGYGTAVLARLAKQIVAVEENPELAAVAQIHLKAQTHVKVVSGPLTQGYKPAAPYDVILIEGRIGEVPEGLLAQLKDGGRLVAVIGNAVVGEACCWTRVGTALSKQRGFDATVGELPGFAAKKPDFVF